MCQMESQKNYGPYLDLAYLQKFNLVDRLDEWAAIAFDLLNNTS